MLYLINGAATASFKELYVKKQPSGNINDATQNNAALTRNKKGDSNAVE